MEHCKNFPHFLRILIADIIARRAAAPVMLPVGAITALVGGPLLIYLLVRKTTRSCCF
ncbi:MAG: iron ABC transporter permease [Methanomassiliicoccales archaeon]|nr:iron ABC transporter permease [Methanomassiliicoccales archaeon]